MRIDRLLANLGYGTRKQVKLILKAKRVLINGDICVDAASKIDQENDEIKLDDQIITNNTSIYIMLNKPEGVVCENSDKLYQTVFSLIDQTLVKCFVAGRLDVDTTGFVFITNDGVLAHKLFSNKKHIPKTYEFKVSETLTAAQIKLLEAGSINLDHHNILPAKLNKISELHYRLTIMEGKYHQVKRLLNAVGSNCIDLNRICIGELHLDKSLKPGEWRHMSLDEINLMLKKGC